MEDLWIQYQTEIEVLMPSTYVFEESITIGEFPCHLMLGQEGAVMPQVDLGFWILAKAAGRP